VRVEKTLPELRGTSTGGCGRKKKEEDVKRLGNRCELERKILLRYLPVLGDGSITG